MSKMDYIYGYNIIVRILNRNHYYLGITSTSLFAAWFVLTLLSLLPSVHLPWGYVLVAFILNSLSFLIDRFHKKVTKIEYDREDWKPGGEDGYLITIPEEVHKLGKSPSVECKVLKNGIERSLGASITTDSHGSTVYINSCTNTIGIMVILKA